MEFGSGKTWVAHKCVTSIVSAMPVYTNCKVHLGFVCLFQG